MSYNEIKEDNELNSIKKPDFSTEHTGFKKDQSAKFLPLKRTNLNKNTKKNKINP